MGEVYRKTHTTWKVDGSTPMYWFIISPYKATFWGLAPSTFQMVYIVHSITMNYIYAAMSRVTLDIHIGSLHAHTHTYIYIYIYIMYVSTSTSTFIQMSCHVISPAKKCHVFLSSSSLPSLATQSAKDIGLMSDGAFTALGAKQTEVPVGGK